MISLYHFITMGLMIGGAIAFGVAGGHRFGILAGLLAACLGAYLTLVTARLLRLLLICLVNKLENR